MMKSREQEFPMEACSYPPYPFSEADLAPERLMPGVEFTLAQFSSWRDDNPSKIADYIALCQEQLKRAEAEQDTPTRLRRVLFPAAKHQYKTMHQEREITVFALRNLAEIPDENTLTRFSRETLLQENALRELISSSGRKQTVELLGVTGLADHPEMTVLKDRLTNLYRILPEKVIRNGAMGKIARTVLGVTTIASYDMLGATPEEKTAHLTRVVHGAIVYGAVYAIIDDTLQDIADSHFSADDHDRFRRTILQGLRTGAPIEGKDLPDHPVSDELKQLYDILTEQYSIANYPYLYNAAESLYLAQDRDAAITINSREKPALSKLYSDLFIRAGMTRVVANALARKTLDSDFYNRCLNSMIVHQFRDDLVDYEEDRGADNLTAFTYPAHEADTNPLYDMFAYDAYAADMIHQNTSSILAYSQAIFLSPYLSSHPERSSELIKQYGGNAPDELSRFIFTAATVSKDTIKRLLPIDQAFRAAVNQAAENRDQKGIDPRTFILDRAMFLGSLITEYLEDRMNTAPDNELFPIMQYALEAGGKRLRPALTLMLAEELGVEPDSLRPLLIGSELFHTASLLFDDLPWQDNSALRRGKPTAHTIYAPASVELTGVSMIMEGIRVLQELEPGFQAEDVVEVTRYISSTIQDISLGQNRDLRLTDGGKDSVTPDDVLEMYHLKTSLAIEAALVPLMILEKRPAAEITQIKAYARHAGLVFQLKDDLLDKQSTAEVLGKEVRADEEKANIIKLLGTEEAEKLVTYHLNEAVMACRQLPFNTQLLEGMVTYFADRKR
jgi:geranylgeranyl pyrophosphate synthase